MPRRFLICLAFATWCFANTWVEFAEGESAYYCRYEPIRAVVIPAVCWEIVLAAGLFGLWEFSRARRLTNWLPAHALFLASCAFPFGIGAVAAMRILPFDVVPVVRAPWFWPAVLVAAVVPLGFVLLRPYTVSWLTRGLFLYSWPVLAIVYIQAGRETLFKYDPGQYRDRALAAPTLARVTGVRVVWIIFDELSQSITFGKRRAGLMLPNLDRLKDESFYATSAKAPADSTKISMPSLTLGEEVVLAIPQGPDGLSLVKRSNADSFEWNAASNVFDDARQLGFNTALVGWYHPYGRLLSRSLTKCYWTAGWLNPGVEEPSWPQGLLKAMSERARLQIAALPGLGHLPGMFPGIYNRRAKIERFNYLLDRTVEVVTDRSVGLVLVHLPVPHPPAIYNRSENALTAQGRIGYLDSVVLVDHTLGAIRRSMEEAGLWDRTAVLVSADHGWRTFLWRGGPEWTTEDEAASHEDTSGVPFLLKLPGQKSTTVYRKPFSTVVTRALIARIMAGELIDSNAIAKFIEHVGGHN